MDASGNPIGVVVERPVSVTQFVVRGTLEATASDGTVTITPTWVDTTGALDTWEYILGGAAPVSVPGGTSSVTVSSDLGINGVEVYSGQA